MVEVSLFLCWKPGPDMGIEGEENFNPEILKEYGEDLKTHLATTADRLKLLRQNGWDYQGTLYDIICIKDVSLQEAKKELKKLKIEEEPIELDEEF